MTEYVELHAASAFSFLDGASQPDALIERAAYLEMPAIAIADRNGLYGAARFHSAAARSNVKAHIGAEIAVSSFVDKLTPPEWLPHQHKREPSRVTLLCTSQIGYQNLSQLITRLKMREPTKAEGAATLLDLEEFSAGLICLTGGDEGPLAGALHKRAGIDGSGVVKRLEAVYGRGNLYLELQRHQSRAQESRNAAIVSIADSLNLPVVATNGVRYAVQEDRPLLDVFTAIRHGKSLDEAGRLLATNSSRHLRSGREMRLLFHDIPEAIDNTLFISERLQFTLDDLGYQFPQYPVPDRDTMDSFLAKRVEEGVRRRYGNIAKRRLLEKARAQVGRELALVAQLGFAGYFLIVWDIIRYCKQEGILVQGRGSAANSAVCYALEITAVDPIEMELLFERFLSENRDEWPDIDLDLPSGDEREKVIQHIYEQYGALGSAIAANVITYRGRSAARQVGKALGFDDDTIARLSGLIGHWEWHGPNDTLASNFKLAGFDIRNPRITHYRDLCSRIQGMPRHLGQHSGGMIVCAGMLNRVVPIERCSMPGRTVVQWDKEDCADLGIIKIDLLGLGMMAVLTDCTELVSQHYGTRINMASLPQEQGVYDALESEDNALIQATLAGVPDASIDENRIRLDMATLPQDPEVYRTLREADTIGMFQVESRAQMASIPHNAPKRFYDLVVQVAIIRPGPIVGKMMNPYMRRRQGKEEITYPHPSLEPVLKRTLGVPLFQEQLLRMAMVVANFTGAEAEELRRAVGMRRSMQRMKDLEGRLRAGMTLNGIEPEAQDNIVQGISSFAMYGFPESHAASFALIAYASAYIKVHYLAAFTCALLNNQPMGFYSPDVLLRDAKRHELRVLPIDVQRSQWLCTLAGEADGSISLRMGLNYVKGLRKSSAEAIVNARQMDGEFLSIDACAQRVPELNRSEMVALAGVGALNYISEVEHRRDALWQAEQATRSVGPLLRSISKQKKARSPLAKMTIQERLVADYMGMGLTVGPHPIAYSRAKLREDGILSSRELRQYSNHALVRIAGSIIARQRPGTAKGFVFLSVEDEMGIFNVIITPSVFEQIRVMISRCHFLIIQGRLQIADSVVHIKFQEFKPLLMPNIEVPAHNYH
jgi:error-prone DNA polymerase